MLEAMERRLRTSFDQQTQQMRDNALRMEGENAALRSLVTNSATTATASTTVTDNIDKEHYPSECLTVLDIFPGIHPKYTKQILDGSFDPLNLLKLIPEMKAAPTSSPDQFSLTSDSTLAAKKTTEQHKDFGKSPTKWVAAFQVYATIFHFLFGDEHSGVMAAAIQFSIEILPMGVSGLSSGYSTPYLSGVQGRRGH